MKFATSLLLATSTAALKLRVRDGPYRNLFDFCDELDGEISGQIELKDIDFLVGAGREVLGPEIIPWSLDKAVYLWEDDILIDSNHKVNVILGTTCREKGEKADTCNLAIKELYGYVSQVNGKPPAPTNPETNRPDTDPETNKPDTPPAAEKEEEAKPSPRDMAEYAL